MSNPVLFISYSWSSPDHEEWVLRLATELTENGIDVRIDKWDLKPGHDANAYMESMVTDKNVERVIMICDKTYAEKSNSRHGGAGTEAQIITPEIYKAVKQEKFVAVVVEKNEDGEPFLPAYCKGRIYFDLSEPSRYSDGVEKLVRWAWGETDYERPPLGKRPPSEPTATSPTSLKIASAFQRAVSAIRSGAHNARVSAEEFLDLVAVDLASRQLQYDKAPDFDDKVVSGIEDTYDIVDHVTDYLLTVYRHDQEDHHFNPIHCFFEKVLATYDRSQAGGLISNVDEDIKQFVGHELFVRNIAALISSGKFQAAAKYIHTEYYMTSSYRSENMHTYLEFLTPVESLQIRNRRLDLRRYSLRYDMLKARADRGRLPFRKMMEADFVLYLCSLQRDGSWYWGPVTLAVIDRFHQPFEIFARARSLHYYRGIAEMLGYGPPEQLKFAVANAIASDRIPRLNIGRLDVKRLMNFDEIGTKP